MRASFGQNWYNEAKIVNEGFSLDVSSYKSTRDKIGSVFLEIVRQSFTTSTTSRRHLFVLQGCKTIRKTTRKTKRESYMFH